MIRPWLVALICARIEICFILFLACLNMEVISSTSI